MTIKINSKNLRKRRLKKGITQVQLATEIGCSKANISRLEIVGRTTTNEITANAIAKALDCSLEYLSGDTNDPTVIVLTEKEKFIERITNSLDMLPIERLESVSDIIDLLCKASEGKIKTVIAVIKAVLNS